MTGTPLPPSVSYESGLEYLMIPEGGVWPPTTPPGQQFGSPIPYTWGPSHVDVPIVGYRIGTRSYAQTTSVSPGVGVPGAPTYVPGSTVVTRAYPGWQLYEQTLTVISDPQDQLYKNYDGEELFGAPPGSYGGYAYAGIKDETEYNVFEVFDQSVIDWIPRLTKPEKWDIFELDSPPLHTISGIPPVLPLDETVSPPKYPVDTYTSFDLDTREVVPVVYQLTTRHSGGTNVVNVTHPVLIPQRGWAHLVTEGVRDNYYQHGYYPYLNRDYENGGIYE